MSLCKALLTRTLHSCTVLSMTIAEYLAFTKMTPREFADLVGVDQSTVWRWMTGKTAPEAEQCDRIEKVTKGVVTLEKILEPYRSRKANHTSDAA